METRNTQRTIGPLAFVCLVAAILLSTPGASAAPAGVPAMLAADVSGPYSWQLTPDEQFVVYRGRSNGGNSRLYYVPTRGGAARELDSSMPPSSSVDSFNISPDSKRVAYTVRDRTVDGAGLNVIEIGSDISTKLYGGSDSFGPPKFSPDGRWIALPSLGGTSVVPTSGGDSLVIEPPSDPSIHLPGYLFVDNSIFFYDAMVPGFATLYRQELDGSPAVQLGEFEGGVRQLEVTPDGSHVLVAQNDGVVAYPTDGSPGFRIGQTSVTEWSFQVRPDSDTVVLTGYPDGDREIFVTTISGRTDRRLNQPLKANEHISAMILDTPGDEVFYVVSPDNEPARLYGASVHGGTPRLVPTDDTLTATSTIQAAGSDHIVGLTNKTVHSYPTNSQGRVVRLSRSSHEASSAIASPDGKRTIYNDSDGLFAVPTSGGATVRLTAGLGAKPYVITEDSATVIYAVRGSSGQRSSLFSVDSGLRCGGEFATIVGSNKSSTQIGTSGRDVIHSQGGDDVIKGLGGDDVICGGDGDDTVNAGSGADRVYGNRGDDIIRGRKGNDILKGGKGNDRIYGNAGRDTLRGQSGDDTLNGGKAKDICKGGKGADRLRRC